MGMLLEIANPARTESSRLSLLPSTKLSRLLAWALGGLALIYALFAGLRTVGDPDIGWQLATGRWIVQHHQIPYNDILSYTTAGQEWIYPVLSQVSFYLLYQLGGYSLLSWLSAAACVATTAVLLRGNTVTRVLAVIAVPIVASRTAPRAELFTELLFAVFVSILWHYQRSGRGRLWLLPPLMFLWVNLHQGFISGLGMCAGYVFLEFGDALFADRRPAVLNRLRAAAPWLLATLATTLLNPWGLWNYVGMASLVPVHSNRWIVELMSIPLAWSRVAQGLVPRDPGSGFWWLLVAAILAVVAAAIQRRLAPAILLIASIYLVFHAIRFQGPFATVVVVIGGAILSDVFNSSWVHSLWERVQLPKLALKSFAPKPLPVLMAAFIALAALTGVRIWDLATNRYYLRTSMQLSTFGPGVSAWYPEHAATFLKRERLPGNIFNDYTAGGFVAWRLLPEYPDYIDGRGVPSSGHLFRSMELVGEALDSPKWQMEASSRNINTVFVSLDFELGGANLEQFCRSRSWRLVFLDTTAAIFVRLTPETAALVERLQQDCSDVRFDTPPLAHGIRGQSERYYYHRNAAAILNSLGRSKEALPQLELAERISPDNAALHYLKGIALFHINSKDAQIERELRRSLDLEFSDMAAVALARIYENQERYSDAAAILIRGADWSQQSYNFHMELGFVQLALGQPNQSLLSFTKAEKESPFEKDSASLGADFNARIAEGRANTWRSLGDLGQATAFLKESIRYTPEDSRRWLALAQLYEERGMQRDAIDAQQRGTSLKQ